MNSRAATEMAAVAASAPVTLVTAGIPDTLISVAVGLIGVWLARIVFVNRENRRLEQPQTWAETLPVTLAGCLIAAAIIYDQRLGVSASVFTGLGVGWTTVLILEFFGDRIIAAMRAAAGLEAKPAGPPDGPASQEVMANKDQESFDNILDRIDQTPAGRDYQPPHK